ncbi:energy transducer TonB [Stenotrophomonas indicatrix]|uniref:energy transducer TonB n=1 Tax=Stenotrophomonas indicatrix TaxID=2045451 RepID=UPI0028A22624|nr:energy transducer TonB [Stenotrophomonas indicatrix]
MPPMLLRVAAITLALALSQVATAASPEPLQLPQAEALTYWKPVEGTFRPQLNVDPGRVPFAEEVTVAYSVNKRGRTYDVKVVEAKPSTAFSGWALNAVKAMRFTATDSNTERTPIRSEMTARWGSGK